MKKLKLKLDGIKEMLSRDQMKRVSGGYGESHTCTFVYESDSPCPGGYYDAPCISALSECQTSADTQCANDDCCHTVTCE